MNMQQIDYILVLAEERSFSKAADRLFMTQSALSQYVRKLEQQLGTPLLNRGNGPITLTPEGELYVEAMQRIKTNMLDFHQQLADLTELRTGRLVIGTCPFRATNLLPRVIKDFTTAFPGIDLEIVTGNMSELKDKLLSGDLDFCIENDSFEKDLFHCESLFTETHYLALPADHPLNDELGADPLTPEDIIEETMAFFQAKPANLDAFSETRIITVKPTNSFHKCHKDIFKEAEIKPQNTTLVDNIETAFRWADTGIAPAIIPDSLILHGNYKSHPNYYKLDLIHASQDIVFAMRNGRYVSVAAKKFLDMLRTLIGFGTWNSPM